MSYDVYAAMGHPDPEVMNAKADLAVRIHLTIEERGLSRSDAAALLKISKAKLANILNGDFHDIPMATLVECLNLLGHDVEIAIKAPTQTPDGPGKTSVTAA